MAPCECKIIPVSTARYICKCRQCYARIERDLAELAALRAVAEAAENAGFGRDGFTAGPLAEAVIRWREAAK